MTSVEDLRAAIDQAWQQGDTLGPGSAPAALHAVLDDCLAGLEAGTLRVAEPTVGGWRVNEWLKKAVLLYFRVHGNDVVTGQPMNWYDKVPLRWSGAGGDAIRELGARVVPPAVVRRGAHVGKGAVLMPSYVNIGAFVGAGTMVDTWATVGSCAQIGERVHLSGGVGIGGVLEPLQAAPTVIEDDCFIGARSEVVEGVIVERGAVISMGVYLGQSTRVYDRESGEVHRGRVPAGAVVVPGTLPAADGSHSLYAAIIVKRVDEKTRARTSVNELLRSAEGVNHER